MAHRESGLFMRTISDEVLNQAADRMLSGKRKLRASSKRLIEDRQGCIEEARASALDKDWEPQDYYTRPYWDKTSRKTRDLSTAPAFPTGLLQTAMAIVLEPLVVRRISPTCTGSIKNRGNKYALKQVQRCLKNHKKSKHYVVLDISKFYPTANTDWLCDVIIPKLIKDSRFLSLMQKMIKKFGSVGIPIGSPFSHLIADLYICHVALYWLDTLDVMYVNYADDIFICGPNKKFLKNVVVPGIVERLEALGQHLHDGRNTKQVTEDSGVRFLGRNIWEDHITLKKQTLYGIARQAKKSGMHPSPAQARSTISRLGLLKRTNSYNFRRRWVEPYTCEKTIRRIISEDSKKRAREENS